MFTYFCLKNSIVRLPQLFLLQPFGSWSDHLNLVWLTTIHIPFPSHSVIFHRWNSRLPAICNRTVSQTDDFPSNLLIPLIFGEWKSMPKCYVMTNKGQHYNLCLQPGTQIETQYDSVVFVVLIPTEEWCCQGKPDILNETALHTLQGTWDPTLCCGFLLKCSYYLTRQ